MATNVTSTTTTEKFVASFNEVQQEMEAQKKTDTIASVSTLREIRLPEQSLPRDLTFNDFFKNQASNAIPFFFNINIQKIFKMGKDVELLKKFNAMYEHLLVTFFNRRIYHEETLNYWNVAKKLKKSETVINEKKFKAEWEDYFIDDEGNVDYNKFIIALSRTYLKQVRLDIEAGKIKNTTSNIFGSSYFDVIPPEFEKVSDEYFWKDGHINPDILPCTGISRHWKAYLAMKSAFKAILLNLTIATFLGYPLRWKDCLVGDLAMVKGRRADSFPFFLEKLHRTLKFLHVGYNVKSLGRMYNLLRDYKYFDICRHPICYSYINYWISTGKMTPEQAKHVQIRKTLHKPSIKFYRLVLQFFSDDDIRPEYIDLQGLYNNRYRTNRGILVPTAPETMKLAYKVVQHDQTEIDSRVYINVKDNEGKQVRYDAYNYIAEEALDDFSNILNNPETQETYFDTIQREAEELGLLDKDYNDTDESSLKTSEEELADYIKSFDETKEILEERDKVMQDYQRMIIITRVDKMKETHKKILLHAIKKGAIEPIYYIFQFGKYYSFENYHKKYGNYLIHDIDTSTGEKVEFKRQFTTYLPQKYNLPRNLEFDANDGQLNAIVYIVKNTPLYRVFNGTPDRGGRLYGDIMQLLPKNIRNSAIISYNNDIPEAEEVSIPMVELDITSTFLSMSYVKKGFPIEGRNMYIYPKGDPRRDKIKAVTNILLSASDREKAVAAIRRHFNRKLHIKGGSPDLKTVNIEKLIEQVFDHHKDTLGDEYFLKGKSLEFQKYESDVALKIIRNCNKTNVPITCIHDAYAIPVTHIEQVREMFKKAFIEVFGVENEKFIPELKEEENRLVEPPKKEEKKDKDDNDQTPPTPRTYYTLPHFNVYKNDDSYYGKVMQTFTRGKEDLLEVMQQWYKLVDRVDEDIARKGYTYEIRELSGVKRYIERDHVIRMTRKHYNNKMQALKKYSIGLDTLLNLVHVTAMYYDISERELIEEHSSLFEYTHLPKTKAIAQERLEKASTTVIEKIVETVKETATELANAAEELTEKAQEVEDDWEQRWKDIVASFPGGVISTDPFWRKLQFEKLFRAIPGLREEMKTVTKEEREAEIARIKASCAKSRWRKEAGIDFNNNLNNLASRTGIANLVANKAIKI